MRILLIYLEPLDNEPMGLLYVATVLEKEGHKVQIIGTEKQRPLKKILKQISDFKPQVVGISIVTCLSDFAGNIAREIKLNFPGVTLIAGGAHPTILPQETLKGKNIDICVIGEAELTIGELIKAIQNKTALAKIRGIAFLKDAKLTITEKREYIENLDNLPFVNREILPKSIIYGRAGYPLGNPCMLLFVARGCPFSCSFCQPAISKIFGSKVRRRSVENVIEEITELKHRYNIHGLWINDDTFSIKREWTKKFCDSLIRDKLDISWHANGRLNSFDEEILIRMRQAGCVGLVMTPETGSQRIRNEILNKNISDEEILKIYKACKRIGLPFQANIMLGSPSEIDEDLKQSFRLIKKIQPHYMNVSYTTALPGTSLYEKYFHKIQDNPYYRDCLNYDIGRFKKLDCDITDSFLKQAKKFFESKYNSNSLINRARHFFHYPYFRKILLKRWKTLVFSRHPKFRHLFYDIFAIVIGSLDYLMNRKIYQEED